MTAIDFQHERERRFARDLYDKSVGEGVKFAFRSEVTHTSHDVLVPQTNLDGSISHHTLLLNPDEYIGAIAFACSIDTDNTEISNFTEALMEENESRASRG